MGENDKMFDYTKDHGSQMLRTVAGRLRDRAAALELLAAQVEGRLDRDADNCLWQLALSNFDRIPCDVCEKNLPKTVRYEGPE